MSDENKDLFGEDNSFTSEEPVMGFSEDDGKEEYTSQFGELEEFLEDYDTVTEEATPTTKKASKSLSTKATAIIAVIAVLLVALIAFGVYFLFFNNSIKSGMWVPVKLDETTQEYVETAEEGVEQYYKFTDTKWIACGGNDYASSYSETDAVLTDSTLEMKDSSKMIFNYTITGNVIKGKYLTFTIPGYDDEPLTFKWKPSVKMPKQNGPEFKKNESILGYWLYTDPYYGMNFYLEFTDDGEFNEYTADTGFVSITSQKYNYDGENIITLSPGGVDAYNQEIKAGTEIKEKAVVEGDTLTLYQNEIPFTFTRSSKEDYEKYRDAVLAGTYEYPTADFSQLQIPTEIVTTEATTEATTQVTE